MVTAETSKRFAKEMTNIANMLEKGEGFAGRFIDEEDAHVLADALMCEILRELGYGEGVDIFLNMSKWYA